MCGIAGKVYADAARPVPRELVAQMCARLRHRGPDDEGIHVDGSAAIGMRRLQVIDLEGGRQPMANEDQTIWLVFNGEIYNYQELRRELESRGHCFATSSDTEVIVHLYEEEGVECVTRLQGMFAFAVWDGPRRRLFLARDRLGKKPLYYADQGEGLTFASELNAVMADATVGRELDDAAIDEYLTCLFVPHPRTVYRAVRQLPPGSRAVYADGCLVVERYWTVTYQSPRPVGDAQEAEEQLEELLIDSVRQRLKADVPLGAFLSGGLDSSLVVALMRRLSSEVKTFSVGFEDASYDELGHARRAATWLGTEHREFRVGYEVRELMPRLLEHFGEPYADSSAIPTYHVSRLTREHVTVALSGDGADEVFGGYRRYVAGLWAALYNHPCARPPAWLLERAIVGLGEPTGYYGDSLRKKARRFIEFSRRRRESPNSSWDFFFTQADRSHLYSEAFGQALSKGAYLARPGEYVQARGSDDEQAAIWLDLMTYLPDDILAKVDRMSMAVSLEVRCPFLDHRLVEFMACQPRERKFGYRAGKRMLRRVAGRHLPADILSRPKHGFAVPLARWLKGDLRPWMEDLLLGPGLRQRGLFDPRTVEEMVRLHLAGRRDLSQQLWALMVLELWLTTQNATQP